MNEAVAYQVDAFCRYARSREALLRRAGLSADAYEAVDQLLTTLARESSCTPSYLLPWHAYVGEFYLSLDVVYALFWDDLVRKALSLGLRTTDGDTLVDSNILQYLLQLRQLLPRLPAPDSAERPQGGPCPKRLRIA